MENYNGYLVYDGSNWSSRLVHYQSTEMFVLNDRYHRLDGPAIIERNYLGHITREFYFINGNMHRLNKPAYIEYDENGNVECEEYYIFDMRITKEEFYTPGFIDAFILENS